MNRTIEVILSPAELRQPGSRSLSDATCVVFDVLRATSTFATALANGARSILPVASVAEALAARKSRPQALLAGEVGGLRITAELSGGTEFDLGNSPREFTRDKVKDRDIISTTTNGTRALAFCHGSSRVMAASWLNLSATRDHLLRHSSPRVVLVCSGTGDDPALEDTLAAGHLCHLLMLSGARFTPHDSALIARHAYLSAENNLEAAVRSAKNAQCLAGVPELANDIEFCLQFDCHPVATIMNEAGMLVKAA